MADELLRRLPRERLAGIKILINRGGRFQVHLRGPDGADVASAEGDTLRDAIADAAYADAVKHDVADFARGAADGEGVFTTHAFQLVVFLLTLKRITAVEVGELLAAQSRIVRAPGECHWKLLPPGGEQECPC